MEGMSGLEIFKILVAVLPPTAIFAAFVAVVMYRMKALEVLIGALNVFCLQAAERFVTLERHRENREVFDRELAKLEGWILHHSHVTGVVVISPEGHRIAKNLEKEAEA